MNFKGFGKNKIHKSKDSNFNNPIYLKEMGLKYYQGIQDIINNNGQKIRIECENFYGDNLIKARQLILTTYYYLADSKQAIPGKRNDIRGKRLVLITTFFHGEAITERAISEGNYVIASAALKQEIEILTRLYELREEKRLNNVPNVSNAPGNFKLHYGDMNNIAHITKSELLEKFLCVSKSDDITGCSMMPFCQLEPAKVFYELHLNLCYTILWEAVTLHQEMYDDEEKILLPVLKLLKIVREHLTEAGWKFE